jgi:recyclin-1
LANILRGYEVGDIDGRMRKYAHVLVELNGGQAGVEIFIQKHPIFTDKDSFGRPMDCIK